MFLLALSQLWSRNAAQSVLVSDQDAREGALSYALHSDNPGSALQAGPASGCILSRMHTTVFGYGILCSASSVRSITS